MASSDDKNKDKVPDKPLTNWQQGDFTFDFKEFIFRQPSDDPDEVGFEQEGIVGTVLLSQTCDLVLERGRYVEVCPLIEVSQSSYSQTLNGRKPQYAIVPSLADKCIVADLDRIHTVTRGLVHQWKREVGCRTHRELTAFQSALGNKRTRFAFPDDFVHGYEKFEKDIRDKFKRAASGSEAGQAYQELQEIRVRAAPNWQAKRVELTIFCIIRPDADRPNVEKHLVTVFKKLHLPDKYVLEDPPFQVVTYENLSADRYIESDPLNFHQLTLSYSTK